MHPRHRKPCRPTTTCTPAVRSEGGVHRSGRVLRVEADAAGADVDEAVCGTRRGHGSARTADAWGHRAPDAGPDVDLAGFGRRFLIVPARAEIDLPDCSRARLGNRSLLVVRSRAHVLSVWFR